MNGLVVLFTHSLLPLFLIAGAGSLLTKITNLNPRSHSQVISNFFSPCLIFTMLTPSELSSEKIGLIFLFTTTSTILIGGLAWVS